MAADRRNKKTRFVALPFDVIDSRAYMQLSGSAVRLLVDLVRQFNGANNGDLQASPAPMKARGWAGKSLQRAKLELLASGLIEKTRRGGLNNGPSLYALTWRPINEKRGRWPLEVKPTKTPSFLYRRTEGAGSG